jgi:FkbM family methyltransferase
MYLLQSLMARLWWSPLRHPFEAIMRHTMSQRSTIVSGPLRGMKFRGRLSQILGIYELHIQRVLIARLREGDIVYDVGGHTGYLTLLMAKLVGRSGHIYTFEPYPSNVEKIQHNLSINGVSNYTVVSEAVSNSNGVAPLFVSSDAATPSLVEQRGEGYLPVPTVTLDSFMLNHRDPQLIKVDVEGAEGLILQGARGLLAGLDAPLWIIEVHSPEKEEVVLACLEANDYRTIPLPPLYAKSHQYPRHILASKDGSA